MLLKLTQRVRGMVHHSIAKEIYISIQSIQQTTVESFITINALGRADVAANVLFCVANGTGIALEHLDVYKRAVLAKK